MNEFKKHKYKKNRSSSNPTLFLIFLILILFGIIVYTLITFSSKPDDDFYDNASQISSSSDISESQASSSSDTSSIASSDSKQSESSSSESLSSSSETSNVSYSEFNEEIARYSLPEQERVQSSYFDDAVFFGDSLTEGIGIYDLMSNSTVIAFTGINQSTVFTRQVITSASGSKVTMIDALKSANPKKIYVMLGSNGIEFIDKDTFISTYDTMLKTMIEQHPDATIYVESILPVTHTFEQSRPNLTNAKINEYNLEIAKIAKTNNLIYLNIAEALKDETGSLPDEASPTDGMHFGSEYYQKWFEYLRKHAKQ